ncbi:RNA binding (RRM/RBD/RNP motifs) family protein [Striga hermonthica]|uniref:RNA binding (RRM/RBD/RNP motifs) family protein n=1 Tax=Striga hermonthica TaxID=68872 RepID=A0A9N7P4G4_STRHE|nr:RNA binding (RRM/RBD/RNP motifs) family protein [Striga hermonthica]
MEGGKRSFEVDFTSEGVSKLRDAIRVKLKEFMGDYTDDTLVEYVIVLLKNGRSKDEAKNELNVFLGDDSDSFVSWLWDHLGSNVSLYVQPQGLQPESVSKTKPVPGNEVGNNETYEIQPKSDQANSVKSHRHLSNPPSKGLVRDRDDHEVLPQNSVDGIETSKNEWRVRQRKPPLSPRPTSHKKRRRTEEQQPRKREVSQSTVSAPRRLLQFAVRDAIGTSRPSIAAVSVDTSRPSIAAESSRKRLRSVVSTSTGDLFQEERPQRIPRTFMSVAIKAAAEAVEDVSKTRPSHNVFDRLGHTPDVPNIAYDQENERVAEVGDDDFGVATENFDLGYPPQNDASTLQEANTLPFHETILDSVLVDDGEDYDDIDDREPDATDVTRLGTSGRKWIDKSLAYEYEAAAEPIKGLGPPATRHNPSLRIASSVGLNTRKAQYQGKRDMSEMDNHKGSLGSATATNPEVRLLKENSNPTPVSNGNAKPDMIQQQTEKTRAPTGLQNTRPPTDGADSRTIFVSNVHFAATKDSLSRHFNKFGEVLKVIILTDPVTGQPKGSAYIEFMRKEAAELALSLDGTSFMSRLLKIVRKSSVLPEVASITPWPRVVRASPYTVPRYSRVPFARGITGIYRSRVPIKPGARSFQWKRGADSTANETSVNTTFPAPAIRGLTYVRPETKANGSSGTA